MRFALDSNRQKIEATDTGQKGLCTCCHKKVISKCGQIKVNHWAHTSKSKKHCDSWYQPMTIWHKEWQDQFPIDWQEVVMYEKHQRWYEYEESKKEKHIADIKLPNDAVIEFQHSPIKVGEIESRERFYGDIIWVID